MSLRDAEVLRDQTTLRARAVLSGRGATTGGSRAFQRPVAQKSGGRAIRFASRLIVGHLWSRKTIAMTQQATEIEVEVLAIDGVAPVSPQAGAGAAAPPASDWQDWRQWGGRVRQLDSRWWPLWVFLGIIAVALMLTVGLIVGVVFLIFRLCLKIVSALLR